MIVSELQRQNIGIILAWLKSTLTADLFTPIDRPMISTELNVSESTLNKCLLLLSNGRHLTPKRHTNGALSYRANSTIHGVTAEVLYEQIKEYGRKSSERSAKKRLSAIHPSPLKTANQLATQSQQGPAEQLNYVEPDHNLGVTKLADQPKQTPQQLLQQAMELMSQDQEPRTEFEIRLLTVEQKLSTVLSFFQIANQTLFSSDHEAGNLAHEIAATTSLPNSLVSDSDAPADPETTRGKLVQIVRSYGVKRNIKHRNIWTWLYTKLNEFYRFNAALHRQSEKDLYLDAVERCGQIDNLYSIAQRYLVVSSSEK